MAIKNNEGKWISGSGKEVHPVDIRSDIRERDQVVESIFREIELMEQFMKHKKEDILSRINDYKAIQEETYNAKFSETGAITLTNFSGNKQIEIKVNNLVRHDEKIQMAEQKLKNCLRRWSKGAKKELQKVVDFAFQLDAKGNLDRSRLATLRQMDIADAEWQEGLELIKLSEFAAGSREYIMVRERQNPDEKFQSKALNFSVI